MGVQPGMSNEKLLEVIASAIGSELDWLEERHTLWMGGISRITAEVILKALDDEGLEIVPQQQSSPRPAVGSTHVASKILVTYVIVEAPPGWGHRDAERDGLLLVRLEGRSTFNLHHPAISEWFPSLKEWIDATEEE